MYFFTQTIFDVNGAVLGKSTTDYPDVNDAEHAFHIAIASAISKKGEVSKIVAMVFDADGVVKFRRVWDRNKA